MRRKKDNQQDILINHTGIKESYFNDYFGDIDAVFEQIETYKAQSPYPIVFNQFDIYPQETNQPFPYDFVAYYTTQSKRKSKLFEKIKIMESDLYLDTAFEDCFNVYIELFLSNEYFLSMKTIWGLTTQILNNTEKDVDLLFKSSPMLRMLKTKGQEIIEISNRLQTYLWEVHNVECIANADIYIKFDEKCNPNMFIGLNNVKQTEIDPIIIHTEYYPHIEDYYLSDKWLEDEDED